MFFRRSRKHGDLRDEGLPPQEERTQTTPALEQDVQFSGITKVYSPPGALCSMRHTPAPQPVALQKLAGLRILLAEDHQVNAGLMIEALEHLGAEVSHALDGEAVCRSVIMEGSVFDVILMDCQMPNMDGFEATRRIRAWERKHGRRPMPIIAMTGLSHEFEHAHSSQAGMSHYLVKPVQINPLAAAILVLVPPVTA